MEIFGMDAKVFGGICMGAFIIGMICAHNG
jgi:hypothetical protein